MEQGELLIRLDDSDAQSALLRTESDLSDAKLEIVEAERAIALAKDELAAAVEQEALRSAALLRQQDLQQRGVGTTASVSKSGLSSAVNLFVASQWFDQSNARFNQAKTRPPCRIGKKMHSSSEYTVMRAEFAVSWRCQFGPRFDQRERVGQRIDPSALIAFAPPNNMRAQERGWKPNCCACDVSLDAIAI